MGVAQPLILEENNFNKASLYDGSAEGYMRLAGAYLRACEKVAFSRDEEIDSQEVCDLLEPCYFLAGHSYELILKSFLISKEIRHDDLKKIGHNLMILASESQKLGLKIGEDTSEFIEYFDLTMKTQEMKYKKMGWRSIPSIECVHSDLSQFYMHVRKIVKEEVNA